MAFAGDDLPAIRDTSLCGLQPQPRADSFCILQKIRTPPTIGSFAHLTRCASDLALLKCDTPVAWQMSELSPWILPANNKQKNKKKQNLRAR